MQVLWKKFSKKLIDANLVECGIEVGVPNVGYNYTVFQTSVIHIVTHGEGIFKYNGRSFNLKKGDMFLLEKVWKLNISLHFQNLGLIIGLVLAVNRF